MPTLNDITKAGTPWWVQNDTGPISTVLQPLAPASGEYDPARTIASVNPNSRASQINVEDASGYTKPVAAHESTHFYQDTRNDPFQDSIRSLLPNGTTGLKDYDYGGVAGLQAHPFKSIGQYNPEQSATMVEDLTRANDNLKPGMSRPQLQRWDATKNTLERPIRELQAVPAAETGIGGHIDQFLHERGLGDPVSYAKTFLGLSPLVPKVLNPAPDAPSVALGFANPSRLVR